MDLAWFFSTWSYTLSPENKNFSKPNFSITFFKYRNWEKRFISRNLILTRFLIWVFFNLFSGNQKSLLSENESALELRRVRKFYYLLCHLAVFEGLTFKKFVWLQLSTLISLIEFSVCKVCWLCTQCTDFLFSPFSLYWGSICIENISKNKISESKNQIRSKFLSYFF